MRIFLSGPMGAGKTTAARDVAARMGRTALDLDEAIEARVGKPVEAIFRDQGEAAFRALEAETLAGVDDDVGVIALGGGTVTNPALRHRLLERDLLVTLTAPHDELARRVGTGESRPLLGANAAADLARIVEARADAYAEAHACIDTGETGSAELVARIERLLEERPIVVPLGRRSYRVEVGCGVRARVAERAAEAARGRPVLVFDGGAERPWPPEVAQRLRDRDPLCIEIDGREAAKHIDTVQRVWDEALAAGVDRHALLIGIGGGVVGDLAAFAASTLLRGVALGQLPTTLLAMVDSSVGGKTGFNRAQGKNLVGTFYQPRFVLCDVDTLRTLPDEEYRAGLAEVVKSAWLDGEASVAALEQDATALAARDPDATARAVRMSVALKARVVRDDEREAGARMLLNLGHTVGHALEAAAGYTGLRHGEAVALGMVAAMRLSERLQGADPTLPARLIGLLHGLGLPVDVEARLSPEVVAFLGADKKRSAGEINFVFPGIPGETRVVPQPVSTLRKALLAL